MLLSSAQPVAASSYPSDIWVANDEGGSILVSCEGANGSDARWVDMAPGLAQRDAYLFRPIGRDGMPGDGIFVACEGGNGSPGIVKTGSAVMPSQFVVHKGDSVSSGDLLIVAVSSSDENSLTEMMFVAKTYEGDSLITQGDATVVVDASTQTARVFRLPLTTRVLSRSKGYGVLHDTLPGTPPVCTIQYYDAQLVSSAVAVKLDCAHVGTLVGWPSVIRGDIPAAYTP